MAVAHERNDLALLKRLVPLNTLQDKDLRLLLKEVQIKRAKRGELLFSEGDTDHHNVYLLSGKLGLLSGKEEVDQVSAGTDMARFPIAHQVPRKFSAKAKGSVEFVRIDSRLISERLARTKQDSYQVSDIQADQAGDDWMSQLLRSRAFQQIPAANIQRVMMAMEEIETKAEDVIIREGDEGDYFYLIHRGQCMVTRDMGDSEGPVELARLGPGDSFGEEALLSDKPRNSNVVMVSDGVLLRLSKPHFVSLVKRPLAHTLSFEASKDRVEEGAVWLDVRPQEEYEAGHIQGSINLPFSSLRFQAASLDPDRPYVAYCRDGRLSTAAAFLLTDRGFDVSFVDGGLNKAGPDAFARPAVAGQLEAGGDTRPGVDADVLAQIEGLPKRLAGAANRIKTLDAQLAKARAEQKRLEEKGKTKAATLERQIAEARRQAETERKGRGRAEGALEHLQGKLKAAQEQLAAVEQEAKAAKRDMARETQALRAELGSRVEGLDRSLTEERAKLAKAQAERDELKSQLDEALKSHKGTVSELEQDLACILGVQEGLAEERDRLKGRLDEQAQEIGALEQEKAGAAAQTAALRAELEQGETLRVDLGEELDKSRAETARLKERAESIEANLGQRLSQLTGTLEEVTRGRDGLEKQLDEQARRIGALQQEKTSAEESKVALSAEIEQVRSELQSERSALAESREEGQELVKVREELAQARTQRDDTRRELERAQTYSQELQGCIDALEGELEQTKGQAQEQETEYGKVRERLEQQLAEATRASEQTLKEAKMQAERVQALEAELEQADAARGETQELLERGQVEHAAAVKALDEAREALEQARSEGGEMGERHQALEQEKSRIDEALEATEARADGLESRLKEREAELRDQQVRLTELDRTNHDLARELNAVDEQARELLDRLAEQGKAREELQSDLDAERSRASDQDQALSEAQAAQESLEGRVQELSKRVETVEAERDRLKKTADDLERQVGDQVSDHQAREALQGELEQARGRASQLEASLSELQAERDSLANRLSKLEQRQADYDKLVAEQAEAATKGASLEAQIQDLESQLADQGQRLEELDAKAADTAAYETSLAAATEKLASLEAELEAARGAAGEESELERRLAESESQHAELEKERDRLFEQVEELEGQLVALGLRADELEAKGAQVSAVEVEGETEAELRSALVLAEQEAEHLRAKVERLEANGPPSDVVTGAGEADLQALQQELADARASLKETQIEIDDLVKQRHALEDRLEDDNERMEGLTQQATNAKVEAEEAEYRMREAEDARKQVEEALYRVQEQFEAARLKADRLARRSGGGSGESEGPASRGLKSALAGMLIGALLGGGGLGAWVFWQGGLAPPMTPRRVASAQMPADDRPSLVAAQAPVSSPSPTPTTSAPPALETTAVSESTGPQSRARAPAAPPGVPAEPVRAERIQEPPAPTMVLVKGGTFTMGNNNDPLAPNQRPEHSVEVPDFYIGEHEVTFEEYGRFARAAGRRLPSDNGWGRGDRPVVNVSWKDAVAYTEWLSRRTGATYRLPTEAEWEFAAAGGTGTFYWWGYEVGRNNANCFNCGSRWDGVLTAPVGSFEPNPYGLYDTAGNVAEWVQDCYHDSYKGAPSDGSAWVYRSCDQRVQRGGAFNKPAGGLQTARRTSQLAEVSLPGLGFRVVREVD